MLRVTRLLVLLGALAPLSGFAQTPDEAATMPTEELVPTDESEAEPAAPLAEPERPAFGFDRVDILSEDPGTWLLDEVKMLGHNTTTAIMRGVWQVKVHFTLPVEHLTLGLSLASQSIAWEQLLLPEVGLGFVAGVSTRLLLPNGVFGGAIWRWSRLRVSLGINLHSGASWSHLDYSYWRITPAIGLGVGGTFGG